MGILYSWSTYNRLVSGSETVTTLWAQVETQYQRRFDLIPNLVASVQGTLKQEQKIFGDLAKLAQSIVARLELMRSTSSRTSRVSSFSTVGDCGKLSAVAIISDG